MSRHFQKAKGRLAPRKSGMNQLEKAYSERLEEMKQKGEILSWRYEAVRLKLADLTYYTPDFLVVDQEGNVEFHEVKGFWQDDARVKIKVAAEMYPEFWFSAIQRKGTKKTGYTWEVEEF
jgi:hypothetical protein